MVDEISAPELKRLMDEGQDVQLIDVRQPDENAFARIEGAKLIPLGEIIRRVSGKPESEFVQEQIYRPLGMRDTTYLPAASLRPRIAPTDADALGSNPDNRDTK